MRARFKQFIKDLKCKLNKHDWESACRETLCVNYINSGSPLEFISKHYEVCKNCKQHQSYIPKEVQWKIQNQRLRQFGLHFHNGWTEESYNKQREENIKRYDEARHLTLIGN